MFTLEELLRGLTEDQVFAKFLAIAATYGLPADSWRKGGAMRVILRIVARIYAAFSVVMALFIGAGFLETATGEWLTKLAWYVYGVQRRTATFAREKLKLTNSGGNVYEDVQPGEMIAISPTTKKTYRNTEVFTLEALSTAEVEFEAFELGSASSAAVGTITELETHLDGVTVTNEKAFIAVDAETDGEVRDACRDKVQSRSVRGPRGAYRTAVREAKRLDGSPVNINRVQVSSSSSKGIVTITVAAPSGAPAAEDLTAIDENIELKARPDAVRKVLQGATEVLIPRQLTIYARRTEGVTADQFRALVETAFVREQPLLPIGGDPKPPSTQGMVWAHWIVGVAKAAHPSIYEVDGEGVDVALAGNEVPVLQITAPVVRISEVTSQS